VSDSSPAPAIKLLDREISEDSLREWTSHIAAKKHNLERDSNSAVVFRIGTEWFALPTEVFEEGTEKCTVRTLPGRSRAVPRGIANVRGELVLCIALGALLGIENGADFRGDNRRGTQLLICNTKEGRFAFRVAEIEGVVRYKPDDLRPAPVALAKAASGTYVCAVLPKKDKTIGWLDYDLLVSTLNRGLS
jgi:chemotaxis-related protein WspD